MIHFKLQFLNYTLLYIIYEQNITKMTNLPNDILGPAYKVSEAISKTTGQRTSM